MVSTPQRQITDTEKLMALRKDYADLEQRFDALSSKFAALVACKAKGEGDGRQKHSTP